MSDGGRGGGRQAFPAAAPARPWQGHGAPGWQGWCRGRLGTFPGLFPVRLLAPGQLYAVLAEVLAGGSVWLSRCLLACPQAQACKCGDELPAWRLGTAFCLVVSLVFRLC